MECDIPLPNPIILQNTSDRHFKRAILFSIVESSGMSSVCRFSKGCNSNVLGTVWCVNLKLTGLVVRDVELTRRKYFHPNATASTHTTTAVTIITTTATKA